MTSNPLTDPPFFDLGPYQTLKDGKGGHSLALRLDNLANEGFYQAMFGPLGVDLDLQPKFSFDDPHFLMVAKGTNAETIRRAAAEIIGSAAWYREEGEVNDKAKALIYVHLGSFSTPNDKLSNACSALDLEPQRVSIFDYLVTRKEHPVYTADVSDILVVNPSKFDEMKATFDLVETIVERNRTQNFSRGFRVILTHQL